jgi:hypothetical protein
MAGNRQKEKLYFERFSLLVMRRALYQSISTSVKTVARRSASKLFEKRACIVVGHSLQYWRLLTMLFGDY